MLEEVDDYRPELTKHALQSALHGTVALRPKSALEGYSDLQWRPIAHSPALETLAFAALAGSRNATLLERLPFETQGPALI